MIISDKNISITILCEGKIYHIKTYPNEYCSLMMLIYDKISPEEFGDCLGMGKCGTCLIEIIESQSKLSSYNRNEETTLAKHGIRSKHVRLACQILIDDQINDLKFNVLN